MITRHMVFPCGSIMLEGELQIPEGNSIFPVVVVCHPHPQYGGDMNNNVVEVISESLLLNSIAAFRFNFRGVGRSEGRYSGGVGEQDDIKAALSFIAGMSNIDANRIGLSGYSFGASVALSVAVEEKHVRSLALVSLPSGQKDWEILKQYLQPKCLIVGSTDTIIQYKQMLEYFRNEDYFHVIDEADHFWQAHEQELKKQLKHFFSQAL